MNFICPIGATSRELAAIQEANRLAELSSDKQASSALCESVKLIVKLIEDRGECIEFEASYDPTDD